jgi:preprotein translocase subunit SecG
MTILLVMHIIITVLMIGLILLQKSEGGGLGSASSSSGNAFSARGAANFLTRTTAILATVFMAMCIVMTIISHNIVTKDSSIVTESK